MSNWKAQQKLQQVRKEATLETLTRLRLEKGDIILVRDEETLRYLSRFSFKLDFNVPLVFSPAGIQKLNRADLLNLLEQLDQAETPVAQAPASLSVAPL